MILLENDVYLFKLLNDPVLRVLSFVWTPLSHNSWFSIAMSDSSRNEKYQLNFKFTDDDRCVWPETHCDGCVVWYCIYYKFSFNNILHFRHHLLILLESKF
jgi:hypothetical protein